MSGSFWRRCGFSVFGTSADKAKAKYDALKRDLTQINKAYDYFVLAQKIKYTTRKH